MQFKFYVLNYNINAKKVENFNIFANITLNNITEKEVKKYLRAPSKYEIKVDKTTFTGFKAFSKTLENNIRWQEWARCEYEISVGSLFEKDINKFEKWDCFKQALPNIDIIAREVIYQYKQFVKNKE